MKPTKPANKPSSDDDIFDIDKQLGGDLGPEPEPEPEPEPDPKDSDKDKDDPDDEEDDPFKINDDPEPDPKKDKDKKPSKEDSIVALRKQRDELRDQLKPYEEIGLSIDDIKIIADYISENAGDLPTSDTIKNIIVEARESKSIIEEKDKKIEEQAKIIKELDIRNDDAFKEQYIKPLQDQAQFLQTEISNLDDEGKVISPALTERFHRSLMELKDAKPTDVKQLLSKFSAAYEKESGIEYKAPSISSLMTALRSFQSANKKVEEAYNNWDKDKKEAHKAQQKQIEESRKQMAREGQLSRRAAAVTALKSFDRSSVDGVFEKTEVEDLFKTSFQEGEKVFESPDQAPSYEELIERTVKGKMFDRILEEYKKLKEWKESQEEEDEDRGEDKGGKQKIVDKDDDWLPD